MKFITLLLVTAAAGLALVSAGYAACTESHKTATVEPPPAPAPSTTKAG